MRTILLLTAALLLAGCTDADWASIMPGDDVPSSAAAYPAAAPPAATAGTNLSATAAQSCSVVARQRADDTGSQGFDETVQQQVYANSYTDCVTWAERGGAH